MYKAAVACYPIADSMDASSVGDWHDDLLHSIISK
jgi:hypothetical protein